MANKILITGATGRVGRHIVTGLLERGADFRAMVRDPHTAELPNGVEVVCGDLTNPDSLKPALEGIETVFLLWMADDAHASVAVEEMSKHAKRIVYLSSEGVRDDTDPDSDGILASHARMERLVEESGVEWTFLRPTGFASNTLGWADDIRNGGVVRAPFGDARRSLIHEKDIADVAVHALTGDGHSGKKHIISGPEPLAQSEQARIIGEAIGSPVRWEEQPREESRSQLVAAFGDESVADAVLDAWEDFIAHPEQVTNTVEEITGRKALTFREWADDHAGDFIQSHSTKTKEMNDMTHATNSLATSGEWEIEKLDLAAYLDRIGYDGDTSPTPGTLFTLHRSHADTIPFENLNVVLGRGVSLDMHDLQEKIVARRRGGYCFEHNLLFAAVLERLGFRVRRLAGRVLADGSNLRTHMLLIVESGGREWLADVGFGATLLEPIPFESGAVSEMGGWVYGLAKYDDGSWRLRSRDGDGWLDLTTFTEEPQLHIDYVVYNHYTSTHPDSHFLHQPRAVRVEPNVRHTLAGRTFISKHPDGSSEKHDLSVDETMDILRDTFGITLDEEGDTGIREVLAAEGDATPD